MVPRDLRRQDLSRSDAMPDLVLIPRLPSRIRAELRRQIDQERVPEDVIGFRVWHETACPTPTGGACGCRRVAISLVIGEGIGRGPGWAR